MRVLIRENLLVSRVLCAILFFVFSCVSLDKDATAYLQNRLYTSIEGSYFIGNLKYAGVTETMLAYNEENHKDFDFSSPYDKKIDGNDISTAMPRQKFTMGTNPLYMGAGGLASVGYHLYDRFRAEVAVMYYHGSAKYKPGSFTINYSMIDSNDEVKVEKFNFADSSNSGLNGKLNVAQCLGRIFFDILNPTPVTPFIGIGIGIGYLNTKLITASKNNFDTVYAFYDGSKNNMDFNSLSSNYIKESTAYFAAMISAGLSYQINSELFVYASYSIMRRPDMDFLLYTVANEEKNIGLKTVASAYGNMNQAMSIGLRYVFNSAK